jgi:hypothetical protein
MLDMLFRKKIMTKKTANTTKEKKKPSKKTSPKKMVKTGDRT